MAGGRRAVTKGKEREREVVRCLREAFPLAALVVAFRSRGAT